MKNFKPVFSFAVNAVLVIAAFFAGTAFLAFALFVEADTRTLEIVRWESYQISADTNVFDVMKSVYGYPRRDEHLLISAISERNSGAWELKTGDVIKIPILKKKRFFRTIKSSSKHVARRAYRSLRLACRGFSWREFCQEMCRGEASS
jgi:hypothetical protein